MPHTYQIIAREEKPLGGVDYNRSPVATFSTSGINKPPISTPEGEETIATKYGRDGRSMKYAEGLHSHNMM